VKSLGLGPAPSSRLAANPGNEIRDTSVLFLLPYTPSTSTRTLPLPGSSSPATASCESRRACKKWDAAHLCQRPERFTTLTIASAGNLRTVGACSSEPTHDGNRASDTPVAILLDTGACLFAVHVGRFRVVRRDRFHPAAVRRRSFSRPRAPSFDKRCAALPPFSRTAIAHPVPRGFACESSSSGPELPLRTTRAGLAWCCAPRLPGIGLRVAYGSLRHA